MAEVVHAEFQKLLPKSETLEEWNEDFLSANKSDATLVQAVLAGRQLLRPESKPQCENDLLATLDSPQITIKEAVSALDLLNQWGSDKLAYIEKAKKKWPESSIFQLN